jgi:hypothetical protein
MSIALAIKFEGKKYLWDGKTYATEDQALETMALYEKDGFEVQMDQHESDYLLYSRRIAAEQTADGSK